MLTINLLRRASFVARPRQCRRVLALPGSEYFKPRGIPLSMLEEINLTVDEFEAIRPAGLEKLYQEQAAEKMKISRQTFGRIVDSAHGEVAEALVEGKALKIEEGEISMAETTAVRKFKCYDCQHTWELPYGTGRPDNCPSCKGENIHRAEGFGRGPGQGSGRCHRGMQGKQNQRSNQ